MQLKENIELYPYQKDIINWMNHTNDNDLSNGGVLFVEMGLGKTFTTLEYIRQSNSKNNLIICSKSLIGEWLNQIDKFYDIKPSIFVMHSDYNNLKNITKEELLKYDIILTTYNIVTRANKVRNSPPKSSNFYSNNLIFKIRESMWEKWYIRDNNNYLNNVNYGTHSIFNIQWNNVICDECQCLSNWKTKTFQSIYTLNCQNIYGLSGTPIKNNRNELITLLKLFKCKGFKYPSNWGKEDISDEYYDLFYNVDYNKANITLPKLNESIYELNLKQNVIKIYDNYLTLWDYYMQRHKDGYQDSIPKLMGLFIRFRQLCLDPYLLVNNKKSCLQYMEVNELLTEEEIKKTHTNWEKYNHNLSFGNEKYEGIKNKINEVINREEKVIIFSSFTSYLEKLSKKIKDEENINSTFIKSEQSIKERHELINNWKNDTNNNILMMNFRIGAEGLNLIEANNVIFIDTWWNFTYEKQAIARCYRIGQKKEVNVYRFIYKNSIETLMYNKSHFKEDIFNKIKNKEDKEDETTKVSLENMTKIVDILKGIINEEIKLSKKENIIKKFPNEDTECCICLDNINENNFTQLKCGHYYHKKCITQWEKIKKNCPYCREDI